MSLQITETKILQIKEEVQRRTSLITQLIQQIEKEKASIHALTGYLQAYEEVKISLSKEATTANKEPIDSEV